MNTPPPATEASAAVANLIAEAWNLASLLDDETAYGIRIALQEIDAAPTAQPSANEPAAEISSDRVCEEPDGCPTELAVLKRFWRAHQTESFLTKEELAQKFTSKINECENVQTTVDSTHDIGEMSRNERSSLFVQHRQGLIAALSQPSAKDGVRGEDVSPYGWVDPNNAEFVFNEDRENYPEAYIEHAVPVYEATTATGLVDDAMIERARKVFDSVLDSEDEKEQLPLMDRLDKAFRLALEAAIGREVGE